MSTQISISETFFKSLSSTLHFPNPHSIESAFYRFCILSILHPIRRILFRSGFEYSDPILSTQNSISTNFFQITFTKPSLPESAFYRFCILIRRILFRSDPGPLSDSTFYPPFLSIHNSVLKSPIHYSNFIFTTLIHIYILLHPLILLNYSLFHSRPHFFLLTPFSFFFLPYFFLPYFFLLKRSDGVKY